MSVQFASGVRHNIGALRQSVGQLAQPSGLGGGGGLVGGVKTLPFGSVQSQPNCWQPAWEMQSGQAEMYVSSCC